MLPYKYSPPDRKGWPPGPWNTESDIKEFKTAAGYEAAILRNALGALCGYVQIPMSHPAAGMAGYSSTISLDDLIDFSLKKIYIRRSVNTIRVHGRITYAEAEKGFWWFGFNCAHAGDLTIMTSKYKHLLSGTYRNFSYVRAECERLAQQLSWIEEVFK